jgi:hypothetical protein
VSNEIHHEMSMDFKPHQYFIGSASNEQLSMETKHEMRVDNRTSNEQRTTVEHMIEFNRLINEKHDGKSKQSLQVSLMDSMPDIHVHTNEQHRSIQSLASNELSIDEINDELDTIKAKSHDIETMIDEFLSRKKI